MEERRRKRGRIKRSKEEKDDKARKRGEPKHELSIVFIAVCFVAIPPPCPKKKRQAPVSFCSVVVSAD
jgi:hypothetical protein